jgi:hypothetical protein
MPMRLLAAACATAGLLVSASCQSSEPESTREPNLLNAVAEEPDTLEAQLIYSQRELIRALTADDSAVVIQLVSTQFIAHDTREGQAVAMSVGGAERPLQVGYFEVVSGALLDRIGADYSTFHVAANGDQATTYALGSAEALRTSWRSNEGVWTATQLIFLEIRDARRMIEARD